MELDKKKISSELEIELEMYEELLTAFLKQGDETVTKLLAACDAGDMDEIKKCAHFIKGAAGNLRVDKIKDVSEEIEQAAKGEGSLNIIRMETSVLRGLFEELKKLA